MKRHFKEQGHTVTKAVRCECGVLFRCGTAGSYYLHRYCVFLLFINHNRQWELRIRKLYLDPDPVKSLIRICIRKDTDSHQCAMVGSVCSSKWCGSVILLTRYRVWFENTQSGLWPNMVKNCCELTLYENKTSKVLPNDVQCLFCTIYVLGKVWNATSDTFKY